MKTKPCQTCHVHKHNNQHGSTIVSRGHETEPSQVLNSLVVKKKKVLNSLQNREAPSRIKHYQEPGDFPRVHFIPIL